MIPGGFQKRIRFNYKRFIRKSLVLLKQNDWSGLGHYVVSEMGNFLVDSNFLREPRILTCSLCQFTTPAFVHLSNTLKISWNSACPNCNSRSRHRGLTFLYREYLQNSRRRRILHFAPELVLEIEIRKYTQHRYYTTDYQMSNVDFPREDIQDLSFDDSSFDLILSNHVLEHVRDDQQAVAELARILSSGGTAIITVPGDWRRKQTKTFSHLNHNGHYRDYGTDILDMFREHFCSVKRKNLYNYSGRIHGIKKLEYAFVCEK